MHAILDIFIQRNPFVIKFFPYNDFYELILNEIGSGAYRTVYAAKYRYYSERMPQTVVLKRFKNFDGMPELFISEVRNNL